MWTAPMYKTTKVTIELRDIVDNGDNSVDIWNFDYPSFYDGEDKKAFERKFIDHYYFRQIGQETVGRWLHYFRTRIKEIMPYYIQMYKSVEIMEGISDPFGNVDITETFKETTSGTTTGEQQSEDSSESSGTSKDEKTASENKEHRFSNTPQGSIENLDSYMTEVFTDDNSNTETINSNSSGSSSGSTSLSTKETKAGTTEHTYTKKGNQGVNTYAHDMIEYRKSFLNVDLMIIEACNDLFLGVY